MTLLHITQWHWYHWYLIGALLSLVIVPIVQLIEEGELKVEDILFTLLFTAVSWLGIFIAVLYCIYRGGSFLLEKIMKHHGQIIFVAPWKKRERVQRQQAEVDKERRYDYSITKVRIK